MRYRETIKQKKSLSQVFLREDWPCKKTASQLSQLGVQSVIEIGPGNGILTRALLREGFQVTAVEKDHRFADKLRDLTSNEQLPGKLNIINADILDFNLEQWINKTSGIKAVCGNIPYNISSPILLWILPHLKNLRISLFLVQLEFGQRLASLPSTKSYGSLSVFTQLRAKVKVEFMVSRSCFFPVPKVDSAVVSLIDKQSDIKEELLLQVEKISRQAFTQRRKKLSNSLSPFLKNIDPASIPIDLSRRCDSLTPSEFIEIAKAIFKQK